MKRPEALAATSGRVDFGKRRNGAASAQQCQLDQAAYPIVIAERQRNNREIVRVALHRFDNRETIDIRSWGQDGKSNWRPGRGGRKVAVKDFPALAESLGQALQWARALGLLAPNNGA